MPIDTQERRLSMMNFMSGDLLPEPLATIDAAAQSTLLLLYSEIDILTTDSFDLAFDLVVCPAISALTEIEPAFKLDVIVDPAIQCGVTLNPERFNP